MNDVEVTVEAPAKYATSILEMLTSFRSDAERRLARIKSGQEPGSLEDIHYEKETARLAPPIIDLMMDQAGNDTITITGDSHLLSNAFDFRMGSLSDELTHVMGVSPVDYPKAKAMLDELGWLVLEGERVDTAYRGAVA